MSTVYVSAAIAFFSTTLDDFAVLVVFFGRAQSMTNVREGISKSLEMFELGYLTLNLNVQIVN